MDINANVIAGTIIDYKLAINAAGHWEDRIMRAAKETAPLLRYPGYDAHVWASALHGQRVRAARHLASLLEYGVTEQTLGLLNSF